MKTRYLVIYKMHGVNSLPDKAEHTPLISMENPAVTATLTQHPEKCFLHIDKSIALGAQLLKGFFSPDKKGTLEERLAAEIEDVKGHREKRTGKGIFLVFECETDVPEPDFDRHRDLDDFGVCFDAVDKKEVGDIFRPVIQMTITASVLSFPEQTDRRVEKIGEVVYLIDSENSKPIYTFSFQGGHARVSIASPLTDGIITEVAKFVPSLATDKTLARPVSLLITSLENTTSDLHCFIAAWSAFDIFVHATFKSSYKDRWFAIMENGAPTSAQPVFSRFREVMRDKYRIADKFLIIASVLDPATAEADAEAFKQLKKIRDLLFHTMDMPLSPLPTEMVQKILLKYMKLHVTTATYPQQA